GPLPPRPAVLPRPEPMPRPSRLRGCLAPLLSEISFNLMMASSLLDHAHKVRYLGDHASDRRGIGECHPLMTLVEAKADERRPLILGTSRSAVKLLDRDRLAGLCFRHVTLLRRYIHLAPAREDVTDLLTAACRYAARACLLLQGIECRPHHVVGVGGTLRLRHHVLHAQRFEDSPHRTAGDDSGPGRGGAQHDFAGSPASVDIMMQGAALAQRHPDQRAFGPLSRLAYCLRDLARFAMAETDAP